MPLLLTTITRVGGSRRNDDIQGAEPDHRKTCTNVVVEGTAVLAAADPIGAAASQWVLDDVAGTPPHTNGNGCLRHQDVIAVRNGTLNIVEYLLRLLQQWERSRKRVADTWKIGWPLTTACASALIDTLKNAPKKLVGSGARWPTVAT